MKMASNASQALFALEADGAWVVGGAVRDAIAGDQHQPFDIDIAVADAEACARRAGDALCAPVVRLSTNFDIWRIPLPDGQIDVWNLPDGDIERDLGRRDFTVNAMAVPLGRFRHGELVAALIDPFGGRGDIEKRVLRLVTSSALRADPLRMLRAVRLEAERGWRPDAELRSAMQRDAALIARSAAERQWTELQRILLSDRLPLALRRLEQSGLLDCIFPALSEGPRYRPAAGASTRCVLAPNRRRPLAHPTDCHYYTARRERRGALARITTAADSADHSRVAQ